MTRPRIRIRPHVASAQEVEAANERLAGRGRRTRIDADVSAVLAEVESCENATPSMLRVWAQHPDERVPLALLANPVQPWLPDYERYLSVALTDRCIRDLEAGIAWTPLLDRAQASHRGFTWAEGADVESYAEDEGLDPLENPYRGFSAGISIIRDYLQATSDARFARAVALAFDHYTVQRTVGEHGPTLTSETLEEMLDRSGRRRDYLGSYAEREDVPDVQIQRLAEWTTDRIRQHVQEGSRFLGTAGWLAGSLGQRSDVLGVAWVEQLLEVAADAPEPPRTRILVRLILTKSRMTADQLRRAWALADPEGSDLAIYVADHPDTPADVLEAIAQRYSRVRVREALARRLKESPSEALTSALAKSAAMDVMANVLAFGQGAGVVKALHRSDGQDVGRAVRKLQWALADSIGAAEDSPRPPRSFEGAVARLVHRTPRRSRDPHARLNTPIGWAESLAEGRPEDVLLLLRLAWGRTLTSEERSRLLTSGNPDVRLFAIAELGGPRTAAGRTR